MIIVYEFIVLSNIGLIDWPDKNHYERKSRGMENRWKGGVTYRGRADGRCAEENWRSIGPYIFFSSKIRDEEYRRLAVATIMVGDFVLF